MSAQPQRFRKIGTKRLMEESCFQFTHGRERESLGMKIAQVRRIALSLPEATEEPNFQYSSFRVRGKIFATVPPEGKHLHVFVSDDEREIALALEPKFLEKLHWGEKVVGLRVSLADAKPRVVNKLLTQAWSCKAPKSLGSINASAK